MPRAARSISRPLAVVWFLVIAILLFIYRTYTPNPKASMATSSKLSEGLHDYLKYVPVIYLHDDEEFFPSNMADFLLYVEPYLGLEPLKHAHDRQLTLDNVNQLNNFGDRGTNVFLTSRDDPSTYPSWMQGNKPSTAGRSDAVVPVVFVKRTIEDKQGQDIQVVDMFSFYFYHFNAGPRLPKKSSQFFGDHIGDLEHSIVRFRDGKPETIFLSRHASASIHTYESTQKLGSRPILFAGKGTHALYGIEGNHEYIMEDKDSTVILDYTSKGTLWDPSKNLWVYELSPEQMALTAIEPSDAPTSWYEFAGIWGDKTYKEDDPRQDVVCGVPKWVNGPAGVPYKIIARISPGMNQPEKVPVSEPSVLVKRPWGT
ncbi:hypothetical protein GGR51DRAFT_534958 [Nemania sp. FL0031]|nr:hypothetical protein GGR51DRAFT_534958 [Nemania sp. FL0031]